MQVPRVRKCQFYKWVDDQVPKHYRIRLHELKLEANQMEVLAVRNELATVKAQLVNAQNELAIEK